ncbi:ubiquitin-conjugating enzyme/RWD-like protein [Geopyxis carbonaria]|nr:ubiquitin-conjugating enzyme/RWD-like protein [Geopyxis carbonaria]
MTTPRTASHRLLKELAEYTAKPNASLASLGPISEDNLLHWRAVLLGPAHSPYAGGRWTIDITVPTSYPQSPPTMVFVTPMCHPNVHPKTGEICLDLLRGTAWSPLYKLATALEAVELLLTDPAPDSPLNVDAAAVLRSGDEVAYESLVRLWGVLYAGVPGTTS